MCSKEDDLETPTWWCHDGTLKRVIKVARLARTTKDEENAKLTFIWAGALSGFISHGLRPHYPRIEDRTPEELREATALFEKISKTGGPVAHDSHKLSEFLKEVAECRQMRIIAQTPSFTEIEEVPILNAWDSGMLRGVFEAGEWVQIHGLVSPKGSAMNLKLGLVCKDGLRDGRQVVQVEGFKECKLIRPQNLMALPFSELLLALVSCLEEEDVQWMCARKAKEMLPRAYIWS
ncbi:expressed unknown protein [Seminavis robusta]|uniref:Uncharacterized protein n=1 Tax=Seminavis robusta TaxID=568900 RepID=A0A9N8DQP2_9STRA|nr:expressed unknown protein [Seminavis robusta]|eukprot:Sro286_g108430.1 n/a (234) ;mRNA; r:70304-71005